MDTAQSQDIEKRRDETDQAGKAGTRVPKQPEDRPTPHSGQDKGKGEGEIRSGGHRSEPA